MKRIKALISSPGIVIGKIVRFVSNVGEVPRFYITKVKVKEEKKRFLDSVKKAGEELEELKTNDQFSNSLDIIESYLMMLSDTVFHEKVIASINKEQRNAEWSVYEVMQEYIGLLESSEQSYLRDREFDLNEIVSMLMTHFSGKSLNNYDLTEPSIIAARDIFTADFLRFPRDKLKGILTEMGGVNSHTSIIARSYGIPMLVGVPMLMKIVHNNEEVLLDAEEGYLCTGITPEIREQYEQKEKKIKEESRKVMEEASRAEHKTADDVPLSFSLNLDVLEEMDSKSVVLADGVGLLRTEFLFSLPTSFLSEEEQFNTYKRVAELFKGKPVTVRIFDIGGDKMHEYVQSYYEENPLLGFRGLRFLLEHKDFLHSQLKAILRVSASADLRILVPMVSTLEEWEIFLELLEKAKTQLIQEGVDINKEIKVGPMIEVPSLLYVLDEMAKLCDFWSVGTNDLLQFVMAADRTNAKVEFLYQHLQPAILRIMRTLLYHSYENQIPVTVCGEMAGDPLMIPLLLGAGLRSFSVSTAQLPALIATGTHLAIDDARNLFEEVIHLKKVSEIHAKVKTFLGDVMG